MPKRPKILTYLGWVLIGIALSFPVQLFLLHGHELSEWRNVLYKISLLNWFVIAGCIVNAMILFQASPLAALSLPVLMIFVTWNNLVVGEMATDYSYQTTLWATGSFFGLCSLLLRSDAWFILTHPKQRWWLRSKRVQVDLPVQVNPLLGQSIKSSLFDLSSDGAFINDEQTDSIKEGDELRLTLNLDQLHTIRCGATVVRQCKETQGNYPMGFGVRFHDLNQWEKLKLQRYVNKQIKTLDQMTLH